MNKREMAKIYKENHLCQKCGRKLDDTVDIRPRGDYYVKCAKCRENDMLQQFKSRTGNNLPRTVEPRKTVEELQRGERCIMCDKTVLHGRKYIERKICPICLGEFESKQRKGEHISEYSTCHKCKWAVFHGDHYSCPSRSGTGPANSSCLRYTAERRAKDDGK